MESFPRRRRTLAALLLLALLLPLVSHADKLTAMPEHFVVAHARTDQLLDEGQRFVVREG